MDNLEEGQNEGKTQGIEEKQAEIKQKKRGKSFSKIFALIVSLAIVGVGGISGFKIFKDYKLRERLKNFPLEAYAQKELQFKEIDFSKVLIYGSKSDEPEKDNMLLYFVKGTATLRFTGLENLAIDYDKTDFASKTLCLLYAIPKGATELPIDVEIILDANKSRLIESISAAPLSQSDSGKLIKIVSTVLGAVGGGAAGNVVGGLFGMKGKIIGTVVGSALAGATSYIMSANYVKETAVSKENTAGDVVRLLEEAEPVIAAQLLYDEFSEKKDKTSQREYYQQKIADTLTSLICAEGGEWEKVSVNFIESLEEEPKE